MTDTGWAAKDWVAVHVLNWEAENGPIPSKHTLAFTVAIASTRNCHWVGVRRADLASMVVRTPDRRPTTDRLTPRATLLSTIIQMATSEPLDTGSVS